MAVKDISLLSFDRSHLQREIHWMKTTKNSTEAPSWNRFEDETDRQKDFFWLLNVTGEKLEVFN